MEIIFVAIACLLSLALAWMARARAMVMRRRRLAAGRKGEVKIGSLLDQAGGVDRLENILVGRGMRSSAQIDHLVRGSGALVVVEAKNWTGTVSGGPDDDHWTLTRPGQPPQRRRNPIAQASRQVRIVRRALGGDCVTVLPLVVMLGKVRHDAGAFPPGVLAARDLRRSLPLLLAGNPADATSVAEAWRKLVEQAFAPGAEVRNARYAAWLDNRFSEKPWHTWMVVSFALAAMAWTMALGMHSLRNGTEGLEAPQPLADHPVPRREVVDEQRHQP